jgi:hypothetical protein
MDFLILDSQKKVLYGENSNIQSVDELRVLMTISKDYLEHIYQKHCRKRNWSSKEEDMNKVFNAMMNCFQSIAPLMSLSVNALEFNQKPKNGFMHFEAEFDLKFNCF